MSKSTKNQGFEGEEVPFVAGSVYGLRAFHVSGDGELLGCSFRIPWVDGENEALCLANNAAFPERRPFWWSLETVYNTPPARRAVAPRPIGKEHPLTGCECGFWAYKTMQNTYRSTYHAAGIIQGYGRVIVGEKGYRVQRARIVALHLPDNPTYSWPYGADGREDFVARRTAAWASAVDSARHIYTSSRIFDSYHGMVDAYREYLEEG